MTRDGAIGDEQRQALAGIFMMSSRLEGMFWEMAYTLDQWRDLGWPRDPSGWAACGGGMRQASSGLASSAGGAQSWAAPRWNPLQPPPVAPGRPGTTGGIPGTVC